MDPGHEDHRGQVPLPEFGGPRPEKHESARSNGVRHARRMSNWTAAALIAGTGAATIALAHNAVPSAVPQAGTTSATTGTGAAAPAHGSGGPQVTHSVATTSGSGVTVTTTTHKANGKTVITRTRHAAPHSDY
jgi:hypothetical protein